MIGRKVSSQGRKKEKKKKTIQSLKLHLEKRKTRRGGGNTEKEKKKTMHVLRIRKKNRDLCVRRGGKKKGSISKGGEKKRGRPSIPLSGKKKAALMGTKKRRFQGKAKKNTVATPRIEQRKGRCQEKKEGFPSAT